ncbi:unnamed protein product, partial [Meganyctiphanes norvegica]
INLITFISVILRHETIWEAMKQKGMRLPGNGSLHDLTEALIVKEPTNLAGFLKSFEIFLPAFRGDLELIEKISYEFVEDQARQDVVYCEARFCPQLLMPSYNLDSSKNKGDITIDIILQTVLKGLKRGEEQFGTKVRVILCCIRGIPEWSWDILRLCDEYRDKGVVAIDIAGSEATDATADETTDETDMAVFKAAKDKGIHRTVHAGETGPAEVVRKSLEDLYAERIGHGYHVVEDEQLYQQCIQNSVHFEVCPISSYLTGAIGAMATSSKRHPVLRFAEDGASFSINTDDPTVTKTSLRDEYVFLSQFGFTEAHFTKANFEAARNSFLPQSEKDALIKKLRQAYGIVDY